MGLTVGNDSHRKLSLRQERDYIIRAAQEYGRTMPGDAVEVVHLDNLPGASVYIRDVCRLDRLIPRGARVLDWGCGLGQVAWLLANRGHEVTACDWSKRPQTAAFLDKRITYFPLHDKVHIDAPDGGFDVVVSSGTLEHVDNILLSLLEVRRILSPQGWFIVFRFPNEYSISELVARRFSKWSHSVRMTKPELRFLLRMVSFRVHKIGYDSFLPIFLGRRLRGLRVWRARYDRQISLLDRTLTRTPGLEALSTSIYCFAQVNAEYLQVVEASSAASDS